MAYGGEQRTHFIWEALKKVGEVYTVIPVAHKQQEKVDEEDRIRWICFEKRWTPGWIFNRFWSRFFPRVGLACGFRPLVWAVKRLPVRPEFCVVRYVYTASRFQAWKSLPLILDVDDLETDVFDSLHQHGHAFFYRFVRQYVCKYENRVVGKARHVWVVNPTHLPNVVARTVLPNISPGEKADFSSELGDPDVLLFVGHGNSMPNYEGIDTFLSLHWEDLRRSFPTVRLKIAGNGYPEVYQEKWRNYPGVEMLGFVKDLSVLYRDCLCAINPVEIGSGSCIKTVEALSYGRVCVATVSGARGLPNDTNIGVFQYKDIAGLLNALTALQDANFRIQAQKKARDYGLHYHSQNAVDKMVNQTMETLLAE